MKFPYKIVSTVRELPEPSRPSSVFADMESISNSRTRPGSLPWTKGDRVVGVAITYDDHPMTYYVPVRHPGCQTLFDGEESNVPIEEYRQYFVALFGRSDLCWVNHNVKVDAHFFQAEGIDVECSLIDTLALSSMVDLQRKMRGYDLKTLTREWLGIETSEIDEVQKALSELQSKDYGAVRSEVLGRYACSDVHYNRLLWKEILRRRYEGDSKVWEIETRLTTALFRIERRGVRIDSSQAQRLRNDYHDRIFAIEDEVRGMGQEFKRSKLGSTKDLQRLIIDVLRLPVLGKTPSGAPSMNDDTLKLYGELDIVEKDPKVHQFFALLREYRQRCQFVNLYLDGWSDYIDAKDVLRASYNQMVRTGRMSSRNPNKQQLSGDAKSLVVPHSGNAYACFDYSQIEYRIISDLAGDPRVIEAYRKDPRTDFHQLVADICGIDRKPAKNMNFGIAFGMGEGGVIRQLKKFFPQETAEREAQGILQAYNAKFPRVRHVAKQAKRIAKERGYVRTLYGRRRALPWAPFGSDSIDETRKAFNTAVQGTAADLMKESIVRMELDRESMSNPISREVEIKAIVHDEVLFEGPADLVESPEFEAFVREGMCSPTIEFEVPILVDGGTSRESWKEAR